MNYELQGTLGEQIRNYYHEAVPPDERFEEILKNARDTRRRGGFFPQRRRWPLTLAAIVPVVIAAVFYPSWERHVLAERIAAEVLFNFQKSNTDNIHVTAEYEDLALFLTKLDFPIGDVQERVAEEVSLVGGRYCKLQGNLAAQLRVERQADGRTGTLYVTRRSSPLEGINQCRVRIGEFEVVLWSDETRVFALAFELPHSKY